MVNVRRGDTGAAVRDLQKRLTAAGFETDRDGWYGEQTETAVRAFQARVGLVTDGIAGPKTLAAMAHGGSRRDKHLTQAAIAAVAQQLDVPVASVMAVNEVESCGEGFLADGRPTILYERHQMYRLLEESGRDVAALAGTYPELINPKRGGYKGGTAEWYRLTLARQIDAALADQATSWGAFQIMGFNYAACGFDSIETFIEAMAADECQQLHAFAEFVRADPALLKALRARKWPDFARLYNGPAYKDNLYDVKLARAYERHSASLSAEAA